MRYHSLITYVCIINMLIISSAFAQTLRNNKGEKLPAIIVSASRIEQSPDKIGSSVTLITAEEIKKSGKHFVSDILETEVSGLSVSKNGGVGASTSIFIRGASSDYTKVYVDGILMNDPTSTGGGFDFGTLPTDNIEQIEILKGSQSVLYGSDAMGGVINITTKQGRAGKTNLNVGLEGGSFDTHKQTAHVNGANKTGTVRYSLAASNFYTQGFSRAYHTAEDDFTRQQAVNGNLAFDVNDNVTLGVVGGYSNLRLNYDFASFDANLLGTEEKKYGKVFADIMTFDNRMKHQFASTVTDIHRDSAGFIYDGQSEDYHYQNNLSVRENDILTTGAEAKFSSGQGNGLGGDYEDEIYSGFANYVMDLGDLTLTAGTRYDDHSEFDGQWTYRFTSAYNIQATDTIIRASHGTGFKTPSLYQSNVDNFFTAPQVGLKAERSKSFDLGITQKITDKAEVSVTGFYNKFDNMIDYARLDEPSCMALGRAYLSRDFFNCGQYQNINRATTKGIETTFKFQPMDILNIGANYTYMLGEDETTGTALLKRPKHVTSLVADINVTDKVILGATSHYISRQNDFGGTEIKPYHVLDLRASYYWTDHASLYIKGENVLDNDYQPVYGYAGAGAAVYMGISLKN